MFLERGSENALRWNGQEGKSKICAKIWPNLSIISIQYVINLRFFYLHKKATPFYPFTRCEINCTNM